MYSAFCVTYFVMYRFDAVTFASFTLEVFTVQGLVDTATEDSDEQILFNFSYNLVVWWCKKTKNRFQKMKRNIKGKEITKKIKAKLWL